MSCSLTSTGSIRTIIGNLRETATRGAGKPRRIDVGSALSGSMCQYTDGANTRELLRHCTARNLRNGNVNTIQNEKDIFITTN